MSNDQFLKVFSAADVPKALLTRRSTDAVVVDDPMVAKAMRYILEHSHEPIKMLALNSGFNSVRILYETFVREEGMSPSAYRAKRRRI